MGRQARKKVKNKPKGGDGRRIEDVKCVICLKNKSKTLLSDCLSCVHRDGNTCKYNNKNSIEVVSLSTPHKFNRGVSESLSLKEREIALNYYMPTKILHSVKLITKEEYPNYVRIKEKLASGEFREEDMEPEPEVLSMSPIIHLRKSDTGSAFILEGVRYAVTDEEASGEFEIVYYLYDLFTLGGLSDIKINDRFYKISLRRVANIRVDLTVGKRGDSLVIGEIL